MVEKEISHTPTGVIISSTQNKSAGVVGDAVTRTDLVISPQPLTNPYKLPEYTIQNSNGVFINLDSISDPRAFQEFLDILFKSGHYFEDFQYDMVSEILFNFEKIEQKKKDIETNWGSPLLKIASTIRKFELNRQKYYEKRRIKENKHSIDYYFEIIYVDKDIGNGETKEVPRELNIDEFIAFMWNNNVRFGLDIDTIKRGISSQKTTLLTIASELEATETQQPTMEPMISYDIKLGIKDTGATRVNILQYEQSYVKVDNSNVELYIKKPGTLGKAGWDIAGNQIQPEPIKDFNIATYVGVGVVVKQIDGVEYLVSEHSGYPTLEYGDIVHGRTKTKGLLKVHVYKVMVFDEIGMGTGEVTAPEGVATKKGIVLETRAKTVCTEENVEANVYATDDIDIKGNLIGVALSNMLSPQHQRVSSSISKGIVESENGSIKVGGHTNNAYIRANKGAISLTNVANSLIIGKTVKITGNAFNCTIVADTIIMNEQAIGCKYIVGKTLLMKEATKKSYHENMIYMFACDLSQSIAKKQLLRNEAIAKIQEIESKIDSKIVTKFASLAKLETGKRMSMTRILVELMKDPNKRNDSKYESHIKLYDALAPILGSYGTDWKRVSDLNHYLTRLTQEIHQETTEMEQSVNEQLIYIEYIIGPTHGYQVTIFERKKVMDLSIDEILLISNAILGGLPNETFVIKALPINDSGEFKWTAK
ncbi:FapA family protein [Candidatus Gracilibacteria bacterium]|nr:FapA family protein [Candidatus Gracilibacteria bacterium]